MRKPLILKFDARAFACMPNGHNVPLAVPHALQACETMELPAIEVEAEGDEGKKDKDYVLNTTPDSFASAKGARVSRTSELLLDDRSKAPSRALHGGGNGTFVPIPKPFLFKHIRFWRTICTKRSLSRGCYNPCE
jgi:hypothetical protein